MASAMKGAISFGLLHVPISLHPASQDSGLHFHQICKKDGARIQYQKVCPVCKREARAEDIVKGYEIEKGKYVILEDTDLEKARTKQDRTIRILHFADLSSIQPRFFQKPYHAVPEAGGDRPFELLRRCMEEEHLVAVAKGVVGQTEHLFALIPTPTGILAETLFFQDEMRAAPREPAHPELTEQELSMGKTILTSMKAAFHPEQYQDEYRERVLELIRAKAEHREFAAQPEESGGNVLSMMDALQQMLQQAASTDSNANPTPKPASTRTRTSRKKASA